jgi:preprotein translocase SecF subunit
MAALIHDALIMCAFMVFFRNVFQANSAFIAALLTIIGYSINNTIIIFDRVREVSKKPGYTQAPKIDVVEYSVGVTLSRTLNTSITTLIALVFLFIFGVDSIREFMFPLIVGMLSGVYASVFLNSQVWAMWMDRRSANKQEKAAAQKGAKA